MPEPTRPPSSRSRKPPAALTGRTLTFAAPLERLAEGMEYYAVSVPAATSRALGTRAAVPVEARVNGSAPFRGSLYPLGGGQHGLRIRNQICKAVGITAGDRVRVEIVVRDRTADLVVPADLQRALRAARALAGFAAVPPGRKDFLLRRLAEAVRPETREKRLRELVDAALQRQA